MNRVLFKQSKNSWLLARSSIGPVKWWDIANQINYLYWKRNEETYMQQMYWTDVDIQKIP